MKSRYFPRFYSTTHSAIFDRTFGDFLRGEDRKPILFTNWSECKSYSADLNKAEAMRNKPEFNPLRPGTLDYVDTFYQKRVPVVFVKLTRFTNQPVCLIADRDRLRTIIGDKRESSQSLLNTALRSICTFPTPFDWR